jgi:Tfp pilus assembly protein FimT
MRLRSTHGFNLLDSMVTLTVLAIAASVAAPLAGQTLSAFRLRGAAWSFAADVQRARQRAITENRSQRLTLSTTDLDPVTHLSRTYIIAPATTGSPAETRELAAGMRSSTAPGSFVEFNSRGLATSAITFGLVDGFGSSVQIRVRSSGRIDFPT